MANCISCGLCAATCPKVFCMAENDVSEVYVDVIPSGVEAPAYEE